MPRPDLLRVTAEPLENSRLIRAAGEIDPSTVAALAGALEEARDEATTALLDLSDVTFMDSSGLRLLLFASRRSADTGWGFFIVRPSQAVQRLIDVTRTAHRLRLVEPAAAGVSSESRSAWAGPIA